MTERLSHLPPIHRTYLPSSVTESIRNVENLKRLLAPACNTPVDQQRGSAWRAGDAGWLDI